MAALGLDSSRMESCSLESAQQFLQESLARVSILHNLDSPGAQDLLDFTIRSETQLNTWSVTCGCFDEAFAFVYPISSSHRDLQRLGMLQTELAGTADFCATYLCCQLLLMKVG